MPITLPPDWVTSFAVVDCTLVVKFPSPRKIISSAVRGGGVGWVDAIMNHQVPNNPDLYGNGKSNVRRWEDPSRTLKKIAEGVGVTGGFAGLMTAVDLRHLVLKREQAEGLWVEGFFTVGVTNAVRAGEPTHAVSEQNYVGTINIILVTNAKLGAAALVGAVGVATESKTAVVLEKKIPTCSGKLGATGTGTDSIVIAIGDSPRLRYSGTHTKIGELIGRVVAEGVSEGLKRIESSTSESVTTT